MVFIGGWRSRRRRYGSYGGYGPQPGYRRGGGSCGRDLCLIESGCCLAEALGCGSQFALVGPSLLRRSLRDAKPALSHRGIDGRLLAFALNAIELYQVEVSPRRRSCCRYTPSCSHYAAQALRARGLWRGAWLAGRRLVRCRPGTRGGSDPVPLADSSARRA